MSQKTIRIYGAGDCGINLTSKYVGHKPTQGCAEILPAFIGTSATNVRNVKLDKQHIYIADELEGSGKIRKENADEMAKNIKQILVKIPPSDFNIVIFSTSGGSGSIIGPLIVSELNRQSLPVIAMGVGNDECLNSISNTRKTFESLDSIARRTRTPVVLYYANAAGDRKRSEVDESVWSAINCLSILFSGENEEMDYKDLKHWLNYSKVSEEDPQLSTLHIATSIDQVTRVTSPISIASLYTSKQATRLKTTVDYSTAGYVEMGHSDLTEVHFVIGINDLERIFGDIRDTHHRMRQESNARPKTKSILEHADGEVTEEGLVL